MDKTKMLVVRTQECEKNTSYRVYIQ